MQPYLAFALHGARGLAVAFPSLLPPLSALAPIYRQVRARLEAGGGGE